ncbi:MAG: hypothetical protein QM802_10205 [Agriterribacter sp.]
MTIKKEDLVFTHYLWDEGQHGERTDTTPSRRAFDRNNGTHMLWVMNWYITEHAQFQKTDIARLETLISDKLPSGILSEKSVCQWLENAWE